VFGIWMKLRIYWNRHSISHLVFYHSIHHLQFLRMYSALVHLSSFLWRPMFSRLLR
jgi:hypothetical protein